jgi:hypothetical protein
MVLNQVSERAPQPDAGKAMSGLSGAAVIRIIRSLPAEDLPALHWILQSVEPRHAISRQAVAALIAAIQDPAIGTFTAIQRWDEMVATIDSTDPVFIAGLELAAEVAEVLE